MRSINPLSFLFEEWTSDVTTKLVESDIDGDVTRSATKEDAEIGNFYDLSPRNGGD